MTPPYRIKSWKRDDYKGEKYGQVETIQIIDYNGVVLCTCTNQESADIILKALHAQKDQSQDPSLAC
jgi:hypothetical protein